MFDNNKHSGTELDNKFVQTLESILESKKQPEINTALLDELYNQPNNPAIVKKVRNLIKMIILVNNNNNVVYSEKVVDFFGTHPTHRTITEYSQTINGILGYEVIHYVVEQLDGKNKPQTRIWYREEQHKHILLNLALQLKQKLRKMTGGLSAREHKTVLLLETGCHYNLENHRTFYGSKQYHRKLSPMKCIYRIMKKYSFYTDIGLQKVTGYYFR